MDERDVVVAAEQADDLIGLARAHQAVIDEDAGQLVADRLMDQHRRHRAVDAARKAADHLAGANLLADLGDLGRAEFGHRPVAREAADMAGEIGDELGAIRGVDHLGVELHAVEALFIVRDDREGRARRGGDDAEPGGERGDLVAVAHPHLMRFAFGPEAVEQRATFAHLDECPAEFAAFAAFDLAAQLLGHRLLAVADAKDRHAGIEQRLRGARAAFFGYRCGATGKDDPLGLHPFIGGLGHAERCDFAVNAGFAHTPCDELRHLAAEIDDEDGVLRLYCHRVARLSGGKCCRAG